MAALRSGNVEGNPARQLTSERRIMQIAKKGLEGGEIQSLAV